ncbi:hypothetical protein ZHAS_00015853 [Anopheles sinensis]|uniref:Uncharacterized protein n=1 Tax=Anopheles sinensis TaxID=74873 RepID=A0A084WC37_ANOSI|nr:hypothetical protein ZHAS_00015853 [Anopheles sinensis]
MHKSEPGEGQRGEGGKDDEGCETKPKFRSMGAEKFNGPEPTLSCVRLGHFLQEPLLIITTLERGTKGD